MGSAGRSPTDRSYLSIREVLELLVEEFPDVTISKIRFLESRGLISPERTPSGYRKFYESDVERLRWILRQQREHFLPLKVIKGRLDNGHGADEAEEPSLFDSFAPAPPEAALPGAPALAAATAARPSTAVMSERIPALGGMAMASSHGALAHGGADDSAPPVEPGPAPAPAIAAAEAREAAAAAPVEAEVATPPPPPPDETRHGRRPVLAAGELSAEELAAAAGTNAALVAELEEYGMIECRVVSGMHCYPESAVALVRAAAGFAKFGIEARHLRTFKHAAERETSLYQRVVTPLLLQRNPTARALAGEQLDELAALGAALQGALVQGVLRNLVGG